MHLIKKSFCLRIIRRQCKKFIIYSSGLIVILLGFKYLTQLFIRIYISFIHTCHSPQLFQSFLHFALEPVNIPQMIMCIDICIIYFCQLFKLLLGTCKIVLFKINKPQIIVSIGYLFVLFPCFQIICLSLIIIPAFSVYISNTDIWPMIIRRDTYDLFILFDCIFFHASIIIHLSLVKPFLHFLLLFAVSELTVKFFHIRIIGFYLDCSPNLIESL